MPLIVKNVRFAYVPDRPVLRNVSITIQDGELVSVVGPNGSGKTTLVKCLNRIHTPAGGEHRF